MDINESRERDLALLNGIEKCETDAIRLGICPRPFGTIKAEVVRIIKERDEAIKTIGMIK